MLPVNFRGNKLYVPLLDNNFPVRNFHKIFGAINKYLSKFSAHKTYQKLINLWGFGVLGFWFI
jgi:hypothetical protein